MEATTDRLSRARLGRGIDVIYMTATMAAMLLAAIIVPIVHKTSLKKGINPEKWY